MKPEEIITDPERIERLVEMLQPFKRWYRDCGTYHYSYDGNLYIEMPGLLVKYDWFAWQEWQIKKQEEVKP